ncbi:MAG: hypothetical protein AAGJ18_08645 [Bacteroidota bacterium]
MKSKKNFKKKHTNYRKANDEIRIKERKKQPKKISKQHLYALMDDEEEGDLVISYTDEDEE